MKSIQFNDILRMLICKILKIKIDVVLAKLLQ